MTADRYIKIVLTVIALELFWLGVREAAPPAHAQQEPTAVVITGIRIGPNEYSTLPVAVMGGTRSLPFGRELPNMQPLEVRMTQPIQAEIKQPITVETGTKPLIVQTGTKPLVVDAIAKAGARPGM